MKYTYKSLLFSRDTIFSTFHSINRWYRAAYQESFMLLLSKPSRLLAKRFEKQLSSKCAEHNHILDEYFVGSKTHRCLRTNRTHCFRTDGSVGKQCILIPGVSPLFVQDFLFGPPATQNTLDFLFSPSFAHE